MTAVLIRILLRYLAAALVSKGVLSPGLGDYLTGDADIAAMFEIACGVLIGAAAEFWYFMARRFGWSK